jgi:hypothetical protein
MARKTVTECKELMSRYGWEFARKEGKDYVFTCTQVQWSPAPDLGSERSWTLCQLRNWIVCYDHWEYIRETQPERWSVLAEEVAHRTAQAVA